MPWSGPDKNKNGLNCERQTIKETGPEMTLGIVDGNTVKIPLETEKSTAG